MKRILITGTNSFIGTSFEKWCRQWPDQYEVTSIDVRDDAWRKSSFAGYDAVFHVAGIAHVSADPKLEKLYYKVNRDLAIDVAKKSKLDSVKQFIFMSSIIVYGESKSLKTKRIITKETVPNPDNCYGDSKLQAEKGIQKLQDSIFNVVILRPPMIYGKGSKGNYPKLATAAKKMPIFPGIDNVRSMLHIDNLCEFVRLMMDNDEKGLFFPQNQEYVSTSELVKTIAEVHGRRVILTRIFNPFIYLMSKKISFVGKAFGSLAYAKEMSAYHVDYQIKTFKHSIVSTETD